MGGRKRGMSNVKWIKIATDIFNNKKIRLIESMSKGDAIIIIWFKLLMLAGDINEDGNIILTEDIPYTEQMLATLFNRPLSIVRLALKTFEDYQMIDIEDGIIHVTNWEKYQSIEGMEKIREQSRIRTARCREKRKTECNATCNATSNVTVTQENITPNATPNATSNANVTPCNALDIDIEIDKEKDIEKEKNLSSKVEDVIAYLNEKTGKSFKGSTASTKKHISGRLNEGYTLEDFKRVIDIKCEQWLKDSKMSGYLRPDTLFSPGHFESYLNEAPKPKPVVKEEKEKEKIDLEWQRQFYEDEDEWNQQVEEWRRQGLV